MEDLLYASGSAQEATAAAITDCNMKHSVGWPVQYTSIQTISSTRSKDPYGFLDCNLTANRSWHGKSAVRHSSVKIGGYFRFNKATITAGNKP